MGAVREGSHVSDRLTGPTQECYFSVIIPVYNVENYIQQCVDSILGQSCRDYEVILVDDGSTDNSSEICDINAMRNNQVRVIHKQNGGASSARNTGINCARGKYILFLDGDDFISNKKCLQELKTLTLDQTFDCVFFKSKKYYPNGDAVDYYGDYDMDVFLGDKVDVFRYMVREHKQLACAWNRIVSREILEKPSMKFIEGTVGEDIPWTVSLFEQVNKVTATNSVYHMYRQGRIGSVTNGVDIKKYRNLFNIIERLCAEYKDGDREFDRAVMTFLAFEYAILLRTAARNEFQEELDEALKYNWLLKYAADKKSKMVKWLFKILGPQYAIKILRRV